MGVHRGYEGVEHELDDIDLSDDDREMQRQNEFERKMQQKVQEDAERENKEQLDIQKEFTQRLQTQQTENDEHSKSMQSVHGHERSQRVSDFLEDSESE